jgi:hypothetical protein
VRCPKCDTEIEERDRFCFSCGTPLDKTKDTAIEQETKCQQCSALIEQDDKFCGICGTDLRIPETPKHAGQKKTYSRSISFGYSTLFVEILGIILFIYLNSLGSGTEEDIAYIIAGVVDVLFMIGILIGINLWSKKQPKAKLHGKRIFILTVLIASPFLFLHLYVMPP